MKNIFEYTGAPLFLDGAMGTMLSARGLKAGERPEIFGITHQDIVREIHSLYVSAGSDVVYANTFCANEKKLAGTGYEPEDIIPAAIRIARESGAKHVCLDIGPIGELMEPSGSLTFDEAYRIFARMMRIGETAGADAIACETFTDLSEARAAVLAARENTSLPVSLTMSFEACGKTFTGCTPASFARTIGGLGVSALGVNCSLGPAELMPIVREVCENTELPVIVKPNAGLPTPSGSYDLSAEQFAEQMAEFAAMGVYIVGGCCGTTDGHIAALKAAYPKTVARRELRRRPALCSPSKTVFADGIRVIGERINPTGKKRFRQALIEGDMDYILAQAIEQAEAGADILDVNVGVPGIDEADMMGRVVRGISGICDLPLQIDSGDPAAIECGLRAYAGVACVNSVNGDEEVLDAILPIVKKYGSCVVGLTLDKSGIPKSAYERFRIAERILAAALRHGVPRENVFIDCLTLTVSAQQEQAAETLAALRRVKEELGLRTVLGVSNVSFGLPERSRVNRTFLALAIANGLDLPIINPNSRDMMDTILAARVLIGEDSGCGAYIEAMASCADEQAAGKTASAEHAAEGDLGHAIEHGLKGDAAEITKALLRKHDPSVIIDDMLIPALDRVGERFEKGTLYLPQLMSAAGAAQGAFEVIKDRLSGIGDGVSKGSIVIATVKGDIHDIGKNIVKVILENYGYTIYDLGRDVPPERVLKEAIDRNVRLVGLSALMTTTLPAMRDTVELLHREIPDCRVFVGGAVLTADYAKEIGADYYTRDAKQSVDAARSFFGEEQS